MSLRMSFNEMECFIDNEKAHNAPHITIKEVRDNNIFQVKVFHGMFYSVYIRGHTI